MQHNNELKLCFQHLWYCAWPKAMSCCIHCLWKHLLILILKRFILMNRSSDLCKLVYGWKGWCREQSLLKRLLYDSTDTKTDSTDKVNMPRKSNSSSWYDLLFWLSKFDMPWYFLLSKFDMPQFWYITKVHQRIEKWNNTYIYRVILYQPLWETIWVQFGSGCLLSYLLVIPITRHKKSQFIIDTVLQSASDTLHYEQDSKGAAMEKVAIPLTVIQSHSHTGHKLWGMYIYIYICVCVCVCVCVYIYICVCVYVYVCVWYT